MGFDLTGIERDGDVGGLWRWSADKDRLTVLRNLPEYLSAEQVADYIDAYVAHFGLAKHILFNERVSRIARANTADAWAVEDEDVTGARTELFDRVLVATGPYTHAYMPRIEALSGFEGTTMHAREYKGSDELRGKNVLVVGMSNTGCDIAVDLVGAASKVYVSHRAGVRIVRSLLAAIGVPELSRRGRAAQIGQLFSRAASDLSAALLGRAVDFQMRRAYTLDPAWKLLPAAPISNATPVVNDHIMDRLRDGSVRVLSAITGSAGKTVRTAVGEFDVEVVVFSTSGHFDYSILDPAIDPTASAPPEWAAHPHANGLRYPRLYRTIFSPGQLARAANLRLLDQYSIGKTGMARALSADSTPPRETASTRRSGTGLEGWRSWWNDRKLCSLVMSGVNTLYVYRLFDGERGARAKWDGARAAIFRANGLSP
ncbi:hypothetical protein Q5752_006829 [Cryptotrichosporon argae]